MILLLRVVFVIGNRRRDRAVAEGRVRYDERLTGLDDVSDWKNPAFRYITVSACVVIDHLVIDMFG